LRLISLVQTAVLPVVKKRINIQTPAINKNRAKPRFFNRFFQGLSEKVFPWVLCVCHLKEK
jgi:hypothetical protein